MAIEASVESQDALNRSAFYELFSLAFLYPEPGTLERLKDRASQLVDQATMRTDSAELSKAIKKLAVELESVDESALEREYASVFGHSMSSECSLYEEEYSRSEIFQKSGSLADLKGFYAAFGVMPNPELKDRLDHIGVEMEFMHLLTLKEAYARFHSHGSDKVAVCREAQENFLVNHLAPLVKALSIRLSRKTGGQGFYSCLGQVTNLLIDREINLLGLQIPSAPSIRPAEAEEFDDECGTQPLPA